jgi:hypothetical protein
VSYGLEESNKYVINLKKIKVTLNLVIDFLPVPEDRNIQKMLELCGDLTLSLKDIELLYHECAFWELWRETFFLTHRHTFDAIGISAIR